MQLAVRVVGGEASRLINLRAQLLAKLSAMDWPRVELKGVGVDVWPAQSRVQPPDLSAGRALNHVADNRVGKADCATSSHFKSKQRFSHFFFFFYSNGCMHAVI